MNVLASLVLAAVPYTSLIRGFDKPVSEEHRVLGPSQYTEGEVKLTCIDAGHFMVVEVNDPGNKGAKGLWLRRKSSDAGPACTEDPTGVIHLEPQSYGYYSGLKGGFVFVRSADGYSKFSGVHVYSLLDGALVYDADFHHDQGVELKTVGESTVMRFRLRLRTPCEPFGAKAPACWKEIRAAAQMPESVKLKAPACGPGRDLVAVPVEVDLSSPKNPKFLDGAATCSMGE